MARPRKASDEQLLAAAALVIGRVGPSFTLAQVAEEAGVSAPTLVQRFGSKRDLLVALGRANQEWVLTAMRRAAEQAHTPLRALSAALLAGFAELGDPLVVVNNVAQLGADLADPQLRALLQEHYTAVERIARELVAAAMHAGELPGAPGPAVAARVLVALINGAALDWSIRPRGDLTDRLRRDLEAVLTGWRAVPAGRVRETVGAGKRE